MYHEWASSEYLCKNSFEELKHATILIPVMMVILTHFVQIQLYIIMHKPLTQDVPKKVVLVIIANKL
jgi:hypothetical protein